MIKNSVGLNKTLVIGIIVLFIGAFIAPSINGYDNKTSIQSVREAPEISPLNDDFINAYWKFDECSGITLVDSSSPHYNGTIYGATWTTSGYSGCALVFDGVDDYVNFSSYSAEIMFNKTDDYILSFYFKSTGKGHIYSSTAPWGFNPDFQIELVSNGSLLFKLIGSSYLGITLYSTGSYNDGEWHFVEYYHNGISSNPTVTLYVDDVFDNSMTSYYYNIENDEYTKATMGVNVHSSTDYFDGYIDEFKIIKYEQGNEQVPPEIDGPTHGEAGVEYEYTFITYDPEEDDIWIRIDWGDGDITDWIGPYASGEELKASQSWVENGSYCVRAKSMDFWDESSWSDCFWVKIGNQPPSEPIIDGPTSCKAGVSYDYTFNATDPDRDPIMYFVDWGDNNTEWTEYSDSGEEIRLKHTWDEEGEYTIKAKAKDIFDAESSWSEFEVEIPRTRATFNSMFYWFLERFPMLEKLLYFVR